MNKQHEKALAILHEAIMEIIRSDTEEAKAIIKEEGLDPENEIAAGLKFIRMMDFKAQAILNQQKDEKLYDLALAKIRNTVHSEFSKTGKALRELIKVRAPSFQFSNLENLSDEDLREILNNIDLIKLIEQLKIEENKE